MLRKNFSIRTKVASLVGNLVSRSFAEIIVDNKRLLETFYKRELPTNLIPFASPEGKKIFREALEMGTMDSYFPLAEQFLTQAEPSSCSSTSLVMILNALQIDPKRVWKGVWRWYSEHNLNCVPEEIMKEGMSLEQFGPFASCNGLSVQTFYFPPEEYNPLIYFTNLRAPKEPLQIEKWGCKNCAFNSKCHSEICMQFTTRYATYETFKSCLVASSRRSDFYFVINSSRQYMKQTGDGHFSPIAGIHSDRQLGLVLDTARFKYPSYWCDIPMLYNSTKFKDSIAKKARGFVLLSRNISEMRSSLKKEVGPDIISIKGLHEDLKMKYVQRVKAKMSQIDLQTPTEREMQLVYCMLTSLPKEFEYLLAYYLFDFSVRVNIFETHGPINAVNSFGAQLYNNLQEEIESTELYYFAKNLLESQFGDLSKHPLFILICDFVPELFQHLVALMLASIPKELWQSFEATMMIKLLQDLQIPKNEAVNAELSLIKQIFALQ